MVILNEKKSYAEGAEGRCGRVEEIDD